MSSGLFASVGVVICLGSVIGDRSFLGPGGSRRIICQTLSGHILLSVRVCRC
jgi:hypothetical protein